MSIQALLPLIVQASLALIVASVGLQAQWRDLQCVVRRPGVLLRAILAVNLVVPLVAVLALLALPVEPAVKAGIVIMAVSPLAPLAPGKMLKAGAGQSIVVGLYFTLIVIAVLLVPATLALLSWMFGVEATLPVGIIAGFVFSTVLLPLAVGLLIATLLPRHAAALARWAYILGMLILLPLVIAIVWRTGSQLLGLFGDGTVAAIVVTVAAGLAAGHLLGGPDPANRMALAAAAATRHPGIAALVANRNFDDRRVMLAVILFLLVSILVSAVYEAWAKRRIGRASAVIAERHPVAQSEPRA